MSNIPANLKYTKEHEWILVNGDGTVTVGITDHAQTALGDVTFVDLPKSGDTFGANDVFGTVESVKAASDLYCPVSGEIVATNDALNANPELVNSDPYGAAWMIKLKLSNPAEVDSLLDAAGYQASL
ncbi:MAG: glycine cleavage system protein GcvH [Puniceicoccales bacterium]|jgi:glycine cleavage system H protein|nr:glycine cleavage system protein GcvH [Puniceicoccales bacterium]